MLRKVRLNRLEHLSSIISKLRLSDIPLLMHIGVLLVRILVLQRWLSVPQLLKTFDGANNGKSRPGIDPSRLVWLVKGLLKFPFKNDFCMQQSILLMYYLRRWGYDVSLIYGISKNQTVFKGHAWIELDGEPFAENRNPRDVYAITYSYP